MSALVCGSKRSYDNYHYQEDLPLPSPPRLKRHRCGSSPPSPPSSNSPFLQLKSLFPTLNPQDLQRALEECANDLDSAIKSLNNGNSAEFNSGFSSVAVVNSGQGTLPSEGNTVATENALAPGNLPVGGAEWVDVLVREMTSATSIDNAKVRASRVLEVLEKSIRAQTAEETTQSFQKEIMVLKEHIESLIRDNSILKRAVAIQHERQKENENRIRELQQLKQLLSQSQEQVKSLEMNNYALMMHLRQAEHSSPIPGRFNPDVF